MHHKEPKWLQQKVCNSVFWVTKIYYTCIWAPSSLLHYSFYNNKTHQNPFKTYKCIWETEHLWLAAQLTSICGSGWCATPDNSGENTTRIWKNILSAGAIHWRLTSGHWERWSRGKHEHVCHGTHSGFFLSWALVEDIFQTGNQYTPQ